MEITSVSPESFRIKGKQSSLFVNGSNQAGSAVLLLGNLALSKVKTYTDDLLIEGAGDYEVGGIKIEAVSSVGKVVYTLSVDGIDVMVGTVKALEALQKVLKETNIVIVFADEVVDASFVTSFSPAVALFFGEHAEESAKSLAKDNLQKTAKYQITRDKLPQEMESYILQMGK